ncbi:E3 ubiquitin-protein ligase RNF4-like [Dioscorea cayenensis subsp. rotundata]|uniref:E3 ubiquitin-protein ligase RNF4-like n=1 Tax=Dioscorea cayennensis subsp. rotundata TaxID=55577 RepID=A0AB40BGU6_DIOCR|nr:E3 ubiquitin-protein ligase RNF4-like [Dioscorea cayenensis subsp. rotundata]
MSSRGARQPAKRAGRVTRRKMARGIDLNAPPTLDEHQPVAAPLQPSQGSVSQWPELGTLGRSTWPIDVELIEDDVVCLSERMNSTQVVYGRSRSRRNEPVQVVEDDEPQVILGSSATAALPHNNNKRRRVPPNPTVIESDEDGENSKIKRGKHAAEIKFSCPVCLNTLTEPSSTICGHIFCHGCIRRSVQTLKSCPTCRRKLSMNNFHRVYLPAAD